MNYLASGINWVFSMATRGPGKPTGVLQQARAIHERRERFLGMSLEEKRKLYRCGEDYVTLNQIPTWPEFASGNRDSAKCKDECRV